MVASASWISKVDNRPLWLVSPETAKAATAFDGDGGHAGHDEAPFCLRAGRSIDVDSSMIAAASTRSSPR